jgi:hypothetical protein
MSMRDQAIIKLCLIKENNIPNKGARGQPGKMMITKMVNVNHQ